MAVVLQVGRVGRGSSIRDEKGMCSQALVGARKYVYTYAHIHYKNVHRYTYTHIQICTYTDIQRMHLCFVCVYAYVMWICMCIYVRP